MAMDRVTDTTMADASAPVSVSCIKFLEVHRLKARKIVRLLYHSPPFHFFGNPLHELLQLTLSPPQTDNR